MFWLKVIPIRMFVCVSFLLAACSADRQAGPPATESASFWTLETGSRIAYVHFPASDSARATPLIFVHGGPGSYQVHEALQGRGRDWYTRLGSLGYDVYLYDQIGSGLSARLSDPGEYTVARHVADLEAIRNITGGKKFALIGSSWGGTLVANYMAAYPRHVVKAVFDCPGMLDPSEWQDAGTDRPHLTGEFRDWVVRNRSDSEIRKMLSLDSLLKSDIRAAHATAPDSLMDPLMDEFTNSVLHHTVFNKNLVGNMKMHGMGWWSYTMTNCDAVSLRTHPRSKLKSNLTPVFVLRGNADYIPSSVAQQYVETFPHSTFVQIDGAGHLIWLDKPGQYASTIESFLLNP